MSDIKKEEVSLEELDEVNGGSLGGKPLRLVTCCRCGEQKRACECDYVGPEKMIYCRPCRREYSRERAEKRQNAKNR